MINVDPMRQPVCPAHDQESAVKKLTGSGPRRPMRRCPDIGARTGSRVRAVRAMPNRPRHFAIGVIAVSLRSSCRSFVDDYLSLYAPYLRSSGGPDAIDVEIHVPHRAPWPRGPFTLRSEGVPDFRIRRRYEVLPHLEWYINWQIIHRRKEYVQLHASSLEMGGNALILPGPPGSGKSTLTAGLLARGWSYLCDEFALIEPDTRLIQPYPRALCIKEPSFPVIERLGLSMRKKTPYRKATKGRVAFLNPLDIVGHVVGRPSRVRWVVFPRYVPGSSPKLEPIKPAQATYELTRQCFNLRGDPQTAVTTLADLARHADCYRLIAGDIALTCDLVQSLLRTGHRLQDPKRVAC